MSEKDFERYLKETRMLDFSSKPIKGLIESRGWLGLNEKERAKAAYDFVKDEILFGYNVDDDIPASRILKDGYGQCNTKGTLLAALLRGLKIPYRIRGFAIDKILQKGAMTGLVYRFAPREIFHSYVEAYVCSEWYDLEGVILDEKYLSALQKKFKPEKDGSFVGYGVATKDFMNPDVKFDCCDTYIQKEGIVRDFGTYDDVDSLLDEHGQATGPLKKFVYRFFGRKLMNKNVRKIRDYRGKK